MKKIVFISACIALMAAPAVAADLDDKLADFKLSNNVEGSYFTNDNRSDYVVSTANSQGDKVYAGGSFVSEIYEKELTATYQSSDLIATEPSYDSSAFDDYKPVGSE